MITKYEYLKLKERYKNGYRWIARDEDGELYLYRTEPTKLSRCWLSFTIDDGIDDLYDGDVLFQPIKWEDEEPTKIDDLIKEYEQHEMLKRKAVIPQCVADFINKAKPIMGFYSAMYNLFHFGSISIETPSKDGAVRDWVEKNEETFAKAWICGYEVEEEKQYILKFSNGQYLYNCDLGMADESLGCKLTQAEIESIDSRLMQFAVEVE